VQECLRLVDWVDNDKKGSERTPSRKWGMGNRKSIETESALVYIQGYSAPVPEGTPSRILLFFFFISNISLSGGHDQPSHPSAWTISTYGVTYGFCTLAPLPSLSAPSLRTTYCGCPKGKDDSGAVVCTCLPTSIPKLVLAFLRDAHICRTRCGY
jgi:hypothetical protein